MRVENARASDAHSMHRHSAPWYRHDDEYLQPPHVRRAEAVYVIAVRRDLNYYSVESVSEREKE